MPILGDLLLKRSFNLNCAMFKLVFNVNTHQSYHRSEQFELRGPLDTHQQYQARAKRIRLASVHYDNEDACSNEEFMLMHRREGSSDPRLGSSSEFASNSTNVLRPSSSSFQPPPPTSSK